VVLPSEIMLSRRETRLSALPDTQIAVFFLPGMRAPRTEYQERVESLAGFAVVHPSLRLSREAPEARQESDRAEYAASARLRSLRHRSWWLEFSARILLQIVHFFNSGMKRLSDNTIVQLCTSFAPDDAIHFQVRPSALLGPFGRRGQQRPRSG
jgi:hypothetical protein